MICDAEVKQAEVKYNPHIDKFEPICEHCSSAIEEDLLDIDPDMDYNILVDLNVEELGDD
jgi:hypothetical protein